MSSDLILGWFLGLLSSLVTGLVLFWLEGKRAVRQESIKQHLEDIRTARNWAAEGKRISLRGFDLSRANLAGKDLTEADLEDANMEETGFNGTKLERSNLRKAVFRRAVIKNSTFRGAKLDRADFTGSTLISNDFTEADIRQAIFTGITTVENCVWDGVKYNEETMLTPEILHQIEKASMNNDTKLATSEEAN